jgi:general secretion pathway protein C
MSARWMSFLLWALVAASAVGWGLKLFVAAPPVPPETRVADAAPALRGDLARVLGADPAPAPTGDTPAPMADARFQLIGVVAPRAADPAAAAREGVALIAVDGKPPRAYRVGAKVDEDTVLKSVRARGADLGPRDGAATIALEIPPLAPAATGTLPAAGAAAPGPAARPGRAGAVPAPAPAPATQNAPPGGLPAVPPNPAAAPGLPQPLAPHGGDTPDAVTRS